MSYKIIEITTVHDFYDQRIFSKYCKSIIKSKYDLVIYARRIPKFLSDFKFDFQFFSLPSNKTSLLSRVINNTYIFLSIIRRYNRQVVIHFHDPEFLPFAIFLLIFKYKLVVYDIHEDYSNSLANRTYIPDLLKSLFISLYIYFENLLSNLGGKLVIAEKAYSKRIKNACLVRNCCNSSEIRHKKMKDLNDKIEILFTGVLSTHRGSENLIKILTNNNELSLTVVGRASSKVKNSFARLLSQGRVKWMASEEGVPFRVINNAYSSEIFDYGIIPFTNEHNLAKIPTKTYEYLMANLPVICSINSESYNILGPFAFSLELLSDESTSIEKIFDHHKSLLDSPNHSPRFYAIERYSWENEFKKFLYILNNDRT